MAAAGLIDEGRRDVRRRFLKIGVIALLAAGVAPLGLCFMVDDYGPWPMLIPLSLSLSASPG